jgi:alpha-galactosidase
LTVKAFREASRREALPGVTEWVMEGQVAADPRLTLQLVLRIAEASPVVRFRYTVSGEARLTKSAGCDAITYLSCALPPGGEMREVRLSDFDELIHSYTTVEEEVPERSFQDRVALMGPMLCVREAGHCRICAYEHGSMPPYRFLEFALQPDRSAELRAVKGNYWNGYDLRSGYETIWFDVAAVRGGFDELAHAWREFVLRWMSPNPESRKPYIFYNTWNFQERNQAWNKGKYLDFMNEKRMIDEIEVAHRMGIDVFVLDTGWYQKTGDWEVNRKSFPNGLDPLRERLSRYGMKLGLWFSPTHAALTSRLAQQHPECRMSWQGKGSQPHPVWETEDSVCHCLCSAHWAAFADELIRCVKELGVSYFKWDAIGQFGCDAPGHFHGSAANSQEERADCYAFEQVRYMSKIIDKVCAACPEAIVDFDITEGWRSVGLAFLASGKYFLINNGPYYQSFDDPQYAPGGGMGSNVFVFPGPARARLCRKALGYDRWIPSVLFLTHYLPDDPQSSQLINIASLILGQNGIWGDLLKVSPEGVELFGRLLGWYKRVRDDVTGAFPVRTGFVGCNPEIHEKIGVSGCGVVCIFADREGSYRYVTCNRTAAKVNTAGDGVTVTALPDGRAEIVFTFDRGGAKMVFFMQKEEGE